MNWLDRARHELRKDGGENTAKRAERNLTALSAAPNLAICEKSAATTADGGSLKGPAGQVEAASAKFPFFITRATTAKLRGLGYPQTAIDQMTPGEALKRARNGIAYDPAPQEQDEDVEKF